MKRTQIYRTLCILFSVLLLIPLQAQFDDLYYNPETDYIAEATTTSNYNEYAQSNDAEYEHQEQENAYDDEYYDHLNEYDFYYSSRIRRFHRPTSYGFYDPYYVDYHYYDPFYSPGLTIYIGSGWNYYHHRPWRNYYRPYSHWNRWGGHNYYDPWYSPYYNSWGYNPYYGGNVFVNNYYYGGGYGYGYNDPWRYDSDNQFSRIYDRDNLNNRGTYYGPRTTGSTRSTREGRNAGLRDGNNDNYDRYPNSRRAPRTNEGETDGRTNRTVDPRNNNRVSPGNSETGNGVERPNKGRERKSMKTPGTDFNRQNTTPAAEDRNTINPNERNTKRNKVEKPSRERRSIFSPRKSSRERKTYKRSSPNRSPSTRPNNSNRNRNNSFNRSSRSRNTSPSGINRSSNRNSSSSGINSSNNSSSRSSGSSRSRNNSRGRG